MKNINTKVTFEFKKIMFVMIILIVFLLGAIFTAVFQRVRYNKNLEYNYQIQQRAIYEQNKKFLEEYKNKLANANSNINRNIDEDASKIKIEAVSKLAEEYTKAMLTNSIEDPATRASLCQNFEKYVDEGYALVIKEYELATEASKIKKSEVFGNLRIKPFKNLSNNIESKKNDVYTEKDWQVFNEESLKAKICKIKREVGEKILKGEDIY